MYASILLALASTAFAAPLAQRGAGKSAPDGWATDYLEDYETYHLRYLALECYNQHDTTFFSECCRPMLATETLENDRKAHCVPNATASASAVSEEATAAPDAEEDKYVAAEYSSVKDTWSKATSTEEAAPAQTQAAAKEESNNAPSGDVKTGGHATYFYQNGNAGACGTVHSDWDKVIAIDSNGYWGDYASNNNSPHCGKWINIKNTNNGKTVTAMVADVCPTCDNNNSLDLSVGAFTAIATEGEGMVPIEWSWA